jgi:hypothetical protein
MPTFDNIKDLLLRREQETQFDVATGTFADLEIRSADDRFCYFYDTKARRLIKSFVLWSGAQVDTMCDVFLIKKGSKYTPRLNFWKKDKTKSKPDTLTEDELVTEGRTILVKARVDVSDCRENFWKLIEFLQTYEDVELPSHKFRVAGGEAAELITALEGHDKPAVLGAVRTYLGGQITEQDVKMLLDRRAALECFAKLLKDPQFFSSEKIRLGKKGEAIWQDFFERNAWIFGYGLTLVACEGFSNTKLEQITTGSNVFTGGGKRNDAVMRTKGFIQTLLFTEIKKHDTDLLEAEPYRKPDVYQVSAELSGAVSQVQKTSHKAIKQLEDLHRQHNPGGEFQFEIATIRPRQVIVIGNLNELFKNGHINVEKMTSFELYRRSHQGIEIITFDELYERAKFIVESQE